MRGRNIAMFAVALTLAACSRDTRAAVSPDDIRKQALALVAAYDRQDARAAAAFDAPDYVGIYHGTPNNVGPAADLKEMTAAMAISKLDWQIGEGKVTLSKAGDIGIFEAPYTFTITTGAAAPSRENGTWIAIFKGQADGAMKLWRSIASDTPAPTPGA